MSHTRFHSSLLSSRLFFAAAAIAAFSSGCASTSPTPESCSASCSDAQLTDSVRKRLFHDASIPDSSITVEAKDGVVYLYGLVGTSVVRSAAIEAARKVPGVSRVVDSIEIGPN